MRVARLFLFADWPEKNFSGQSEGGISNASGTCSVRVSAQGHSRSCCKLSPMKIPSSRLAAPGSPRMGEPKLYMDLSLAEFCAGYLVIITQLADKPLREPVIAHFHELMILTSTYQWSAVRSYHYKALRSIELGLVQWWDSFEHFKQSFFLPTRLLTEAHHKATKPGISVFHRTPPNL